MREYCEPQTPVGNIEEVYASEPQLKFLSYDLRDHRTWAGLNGLKNCLQRLPPNKFGLTRFRRRVPNVWQAQKRAYRQLGQSMRRAWWKENGYLENNAMRVSRTILGLQNRRGKRLSAPMSSMPPNSWLKEPCNSVSNAAYYEASLDACRIPANRMPSNFHWKDEMAAAMAALAFGSFGRPAAPKHRSDRSCCSLPLESDLRAEEQVRTFSHREFRCLGDGNHRVHVPSGVQSTLLVS